MFGLDIIGTSCNIYDFAAPSHHPEALFSLIPSNDPATQILLHPNNRHLVSVVTDATTGRATYGINIGFHIGSRSQRTLAEFGRGGDVVVDGSDISRVHFSFELIQSSGAIMLQDKSTTMTTQTFGETAKLYEFGRLPRWVLLTPDINRDFGFGGAKSDRFKFSIVWHRPDPQTVNLSRNHIENCYLARTFVDIATVPPSRRPTRIHTASQSMEIRWAKRGALGAGSFGQVWSAINVDSGEAFAVKTVKVSSDDDLPQLKREINTLACISHPNIIRYIAAQQGANGTFEIFTDLMDGNVDQLSAAGHFDDINASKKDINDLLHHMLQALDYLSAHDIVHRDVKPANILYKLHDGAYQFQLTDFGLTNIVGEAQTYCGSDPFMAPELNPHTPSFHQTSKIDIWSLAVTILWTINAGDIKNKRMHTRTLRHMAIVESMKLSHFTKIQDMASIEPQDRPSAADLLDRVYNGQGRTTLKAHRNHRQVPKPPSKRNAPRRKDVGAKYNPVRAVKAAPRPRLRSQVRRGRA